MKFRWSLAVFALSLGIGCSGRSPTPEKKGADLSVPEGIETRLDGHSVRVLENAEQLEVFSIDPNVLAGEKDQTFYGYRLLGKTTVKEKATRQQVVAAIYESVNQGTNSAFCFDPRHVVRASAAGRMVDFVICFECDNMHVHLDGDEQGGYS